MARKPKPTPDLRPDWRDPNMPVLRDYRMGSGERRTVVDPDYEHRYRKMLMDTDTGQDHWRNDPTYHMRKPKS